MARKATSKIDSLGVKDLVDNLLDANATYAEIIAAVEQVKGETISDSALSRYRVHWSSAKSAIEQTHQQVTALTTVLRAHPNLNFEEAGMALLLSKLVEELTNAKKSFEGESLLELGHLLVKAHRAKTAGEAARTQAIDRPGLYLDCLHDLTVYLSETAPSALDALGATFDGFLDAMKRKYATT
jgi:hypothetical protein